MFTMYISTEINGCIGNLIGNSADLNKINSCSDVNDAVSQYMNSVKSIVRLVVPVLSKTITARPRQHWYNEEFGDLKSAKRTTRRKWVSYKTSTNKEAYSLAKRN